MRRSDLDAITKMVSENGRNHRMKRPVAVERSLLPAIGEDASDWSTALPLLDEPEWEFVSVVDDGLR